MISAQQRFWPLFKYLVIVDTFKLHIHHTKGIIIILSPTSQLKHMLLTLFETADIEVSTI